MDTHRILLTGKNRALIDHIFIQMDDEYECMTTSMRPEDILNHLNAIRYDAFVYCLQKDDNDDDYRMIMGYKGKFIRKGTAIIVSGHKEECDRFQKVTDHMATYTYSIPIAINDLKNTVKESAEKYDEAMAAIDAQISGDKPVAAPAAPEPAADTPAEDPNRKRILVIDDDPMVLKLVKAHLDAEYNVASAISGKIAYKYLATKKVDLILLDYEMPEENGPQVYANIRNMDSEVKNVPIVFLTGVTEREKLVKALMLKPNGYMAKPVSGPKLISTVSKLIN